VTQAAQAAQANPDTAQSVAAAAPGLVAATAQAFRVDIPTAAMMVLQGMQSQEQRRVTETAGPSASTTGFSDLGGGGGGNPSGALNVDSMVGNVLGAPIAGLGQQAQPTQGFAQGGLVRLAAGGLAKSVLSPSSMNSMGQQSHFGALNTKSAPGAHLINSSVPGRVDRIPMRARTGSFVIPADAVSGLGEGNTMAGAKMWGQMLTHSVTGGAAPGMRRGAAPRVVGGIGRTNITGPGSRVPPPPKAVIAPPQKVPFQDLPVSSKGLPHGFAFGGQVNDDTTPIVTAGGEMIVDPEIITALGDGDPDRGVDIMHKSIAGIRKQVQAFNKTLPDPSK